MRKTLVLAACLIGIHASPAPAQVVGDAVSEARARLACGAGRVLSARPLPGGAIEVTCAQDTQNSNIPARQAATELVPGGATAGAVAGVVVVVLLAGGGSDSTSTTATSTTPIFEE